MTSITREWSDDLEDFKDLMPMPWDDKAVSNETI